jgi:hypothetical protein
MRFLKIKGEGDDYFGGRRLSHKTFQLGISSDYKLSFSA